VNKRSEIGYKAFTTIGYAILKATLKEDVITLFNVLSGREALSAAIKILPKASILQEYYIHHNPDNWKVSANWSDWWSRPNHLSKS
jgi:hypothetical protein